MALSVIGQTARDGLLLDLLLDSQMEGRIRRAGRAVAVSLSGVLCLALVPAAQASQSAITGGPFTTSLTAMFSTTGAQQTVRSPVFAKSVNVAVVTGRITISVPGSRFVPLTGVRQIPVGSAVNASGGTVRLTSATPTGALQSGDFDGGAFRVNQARSEGGLTDLNLLRKAATCQPRAAAGTSARARASSTVVRLLRGSVGRSSTSSISRRVGGKFRTRTPGVAGTVRGTIWTTRDLCDRAEVNVERGVVEVTDLTVRRRRTVNVNAHGHFRTQGQYFAATVRGGG